MGSIVPHQSKEAERMMNRLPTPFIWEGIPRKGINFVHTYQVTSKEKARTRNKIGVPNNNPFILGSLTPFASWSVFPGSPGGPTDRFDSVHEPSVAKIAQTLCVHTCSCFYGFNCAAFVILKDSSPDKV